MSKLEFKKLNGELKELVNLFTSHRWNYHSNPQPSREEIINRFNSGWYESDKESFLVEENGEKIGLPMRKVFYKCNFQKEGYLRNSWESDDGSVKDSLVYAIIREDWEKDKKTPIKIDDFPY